VLVAQNLSVPGRREVSVIGDMAALTDGNGTRVPGLAAAAMQQGKAAAANILRGIPRLHFIYKDRGNMATIGHHRAVAELGNKRFSGVPAWLLWSLVHVLLLIGFRNRLTVLRQWL
jgi:NADH:quinone reductase (non-electrogenic)